MKKLCFFYYYKILNIHEVREKNIMVHTATITYVPASKELFKAFVNANGTAYYQQENKYMNTSYKGQGLRISAYIMKKNGYSTYAFKCKINFKRLIERQDRISVYSDADFKEIVNKFNTIMEYLGGLPSFENWNTNRIDYCINIKTPYVKEYIDLMQKGDVPHSQRLSYNPSNRNYAHRKGSVYLVSKARDKRKGNTGSTTINFYDKEDQIKKEQADNSVIEQAKNILRLEVQCNRPKLDYLKKKYALEDKKITSLLSAQISFDVLESAVLAICKVGDYYRRTEALKKIDDLKCHQKTKDNMKLIIDTVSKQYNSIDKARKQLVKSNQLTKGQFNGYIQKLNAIDINPVTIRDNKHLADKSLKDGLDSIYSLLMDAFNENTKSS